MKNRTFILVLSFIIVWSIGPLCWQLYTSFSTPDALINPTIEFTKRWTFDNYKLVLSANPPFWRYLVNSLIVGIISTLITLFIAIPASYSLSKANKIISRISNYYLFGAALFPYVLLFLALLEFARRYNLGNNLLALCIPYSALSMPLAILILTSSFRQIPIEIEEAARIEGLNLIQRLRLILVPLMLPSISSTAILIFLFSWNEYPISLTWISNENLLTLPVAISRIAGSSVYSIPYGAFAAATVVGSIPLLLIVLIFQKQIVSGLMQGAVKG